MLLSIITINYNNKEGLEKTIPSVLMQKGIPADNLEYIIIDGGSSDGSVDVIQKYLNNDDYPHKIKKWVSEKDSGIYNAINKGIKMASGDLIGLVNSGDTLIYGAYDNILSLYEENPDSILYGAVSFNKNGRFEKVHGFSSDQLSVQMIAHPASFVPKKIYSEYGLYDESFRCSADWDLFLTFYQAGIPFIYIDKLIIDFDTDGISNTNNKLVTSENKRVLKNHGIKTFSLTRLLKSILSFLLPGFCISFIKLLAKIFISLKRYCESLL